MTQETNKQDASDRYQPGDHIYVTRYIGPVPAYHHHGVIVDTPRDHSTDDDFDDDTLMSCITVIEFNPDPEKNGAKRINVSKSDYGTTGIVRLVPLELFSLGSKVQKVRYGESGIFQRVRSVFRSAGTTTSVCSDPPALIVSRARHLLEHPDIVPKYHLWTSNCECVAVWCCTGRWTTFQAAGFLFNVSTTVRGFGTTAGGLFASSTVTVAKKGIWGFLGHTAEVSRAAMHPELVPVIVAYGIVTTAVPLAAILWFRKQCVDTTRKVNNSFWSKATEEVVTEFLSKWIDANHGMVELDCSEQSDSK